MSIPHILLANVLFAPFAYGGATIVAQEVARNLVARKAARVSAVSLISRAELAPYTVIRSHVAGIDNHLINMPKNRNYVEFYDNPNVGAVLDRLISELSPDVLHAHCIQEMGIDALRAAKRAELPMILSIHDFWWICERQFMVRMDEVYCAQNPVKIDDCKNCVTNWPAAKRRFDVLQKAARMVDVITYPSAFARNLCEDSGLAPGQGRVWENGVRHPGKDFAAAQTTRRKRDQKMVFGFVGGPSHIKGWPIIRAAFKALKRDDFRVELVEGSLDGNWWRNHDFSDLPGEWRVVPRFEQADMDRFYAGIDVLLFMSQWKETFGLAVREALARGIRVIQTDSGGTIEHGAIDPSDLIPIGAGPETLRRRLEAALTSYPSHPKPIDVSSFENQAKSFEVFVADILARDKLRQSM